MTDQTMTCEQLESRLADYLEGDLATAERLALEAHLDSCERCGALVRDLRSISAAAAALPPIEPPAHVWEGIRSRIGADVVELAPLRRRWMPLLRGLAAAIVLVVASSTITWLATRRSAATQATATSGASDGAASNDTNRLEQSAKVAGGGNAPDEPRAADGVRRASAGASDSPFPDVATAPEDRVPVRAGEMAYGEEISKLRTAVRSRSGELDQKTVRTIERSLAVIDTAIAQARAALAKDPGSQFLNKELTDALDKKVRLLRTAAMLPSKS